MCCKSTEYKRGNLNLLRLFAYLSKFQLFVLIQWLCVLHELTDLVQLICSLNSNI
jgi:hypothetical protein